MSSELVIPLSHLDLSSLLNFKDFADQQWEKGFPVLSNDQFDLLTQHIGGSLRSYDAQTLTLKLNTVQFSSLFKYLNKRWKLKSPLVSDEFFEKVFVPALNTRTALEKEFEGYVKHPERLKVLKLPHLQVLKENVEKSRLSGLFTHFARVSYTFMFRKSFRKRTCI